MSGLVLAVGMALALAFTNGFHDAANAIATLVATRVARPARAIVLAAVFNMAGPLLVGAAVAKTIQSLIVVPAGTEIAVIGAGLTAAVVWNLFTWWRGLPSSSSHALVGGLVGAAILETRSMSSVNWGGFNGWRPVGVLGVFVALALSPILGFGVALLFERGSRRALRRATVQVRRPVRGAQWVTSSWLAFSHGSNDAQKAVGVIGALLVAHGSLAQGAGVPKSVVIASACAMTLGTGLGGWRIVHTIGRKIFRLRPLDGLVSQTSSAAVILSASFLGAPVSTTQVVSSSVVGAGIGRGRHRHIGWGIVKDIMLAWLTTFPAAALLAVLFLPFWRWFA